MALNKERKVLLGLLGSAGLILVVDQVLLAPPPGAQAGQAAPPPELARTATRQPAVQASTESASPSGEVVRAWNEQLGRATTDASDAVDVQDPFSAIKTIEPEPSHVMGPVDFKRQHKLTAVLAGGDIGVAMINGTPVRIGQEIAGYRLIRVDARSAEFHAGGNTVRLMLPKQGGGGS